MRRWLLWFICTLFSTTPAVAAELQTIELQSQGHTWTYTLHIPDQRSAQAPLVLVFHGAGGGGRSYVEKNGWIALSQREGFVVAAPDGLPARPDSRANFLRNPRLWNSGQLPSTSPRSRIDDVAFVQDLLDDIARRTSIDTQRVYATGHSNGAGMTYRLGSTIPQRFAALATVMGLNTNTDLRPPRGVSMLSLIGTADPLNPMAGGERSLPWGKGTVPSPMQGFTAWAQLQACAAMPTVVRDDTEIRIDSYSPCRDKTRFEVWSLKGQGHAWPGGQDSGLPASVTGPNTTRVDATTEIWKFFSAQP